jgi:transposase-like protein
VEKNLRLEVNLCNVPCVVTLKLTNTGILPNGHQRYLCPACGQTFSESFDSLYYRRHVSPEQIRQVLQAHSEGSSLRGIGRTTGIAYNTVVSIIRAASQKAQLVHNAEVQSVQTEEVSADELWSFVSKNKSNARPKNEKLETVG